MIGYPGDGAGFDPGPKTPIGDTCQARPGSDESAPAKWRSRLVCEPWWRAHLCCKVGTKSYKCRRWRAGWRL